MRKPLRKPLSHAEEPKPFAERPEADPVVAEPEGGGLRVTVVHLEEPIGDDRNLPAAQLEKFALEGVERAGERDLLSDNVARAEVGAEVVDVANVDPRAVADDGVLPETGRLRSDVLRRLWGRTRLGLRW